MNTTTRTYRGCTIYPMGQNSWGGRWEAYAAGTWFAADTLAGIRELIRQAVAR